ncbi:MAG: sugar phosphate isomerase/epimerase [Deltaproteobacteria bacterium]|nr:sugar phosphate isomerase/epimerase [Deltaproteobacteria bacterium]
MIYGATNNPLRPLPDEIKAIAALGFDYLELCLDPPNALPEELQGRVAEIRSVLTSEGLGLPVVHLPTFIFLADIYPSIREASVTEVFKALDLAAEIGAEKAVLHPGYLTGLMPLTPDIGRKYAAESLGKILEKATGLGITICLENMFPRAGHMVRPEEFKEVLRQNPGLMMTLDLAHANIRSPKGQAAAFVKMAQGRIGHVHIGDNNGQEDEHLPLGAGRVEVSAGLRAIKGSGYDRTMTIEVFSPDRDYLAMSLKKVRTIWDHTQP